MRKYKVCILISTYQISNWYFELLKRIDESDFAELSLVIKDNTLSNGSSKSQLLKMLLFKVYTKVDNKVFNFSPNSRLIKDSSSFLSEKDIVEVNTKTSDKKQSYPAEVTQKIKEKEIDVIFRIGAGILKGDILDCTPLGIWSYHHGDIKKYRGRPSAFWEVYNKEVVTSAVLQVLSKNLDSGLILDQGYSKTNFNSVNRTMQILYWRSSSFFLDNLKRCHDIGIEAFLEEKRDNNFLQFIDDKVNKYPSNLKVIQLCFKIAYRLISRRVNNIVYSEQWQLIYSENEGKNLKKFKKLIPPKNEGWADPFVVKEKGETYIFFEKISKEGFGTISVNTTNNFKNGIAPQEVLKCDYHLSYPYVFKYQDTYYMIPETKRNNSIELFKCTEFPHKWEKEHTIIDNIQAVDTSLLYHDDKWWMFTNISRVEGASSSEELHILHSDSPLSKSWTPHSTNPQVSDIRHARNGGQVIKREGRLYRVSQDCAVKYGYSVAFHEIKELSPSKYKEEFVNQILPDWDETLEGIHTVANEDDTWVMDIRVRK